MFKQVPRLNGPVMKSLKTDWGERMKLFKLVLSLLNPKKLQTAYVYPITYFTTTRALFVASFILGVF